jgi:hypothetical protein
VLCSSGGTCNIPRTDGGMMFMGTCAATAAAGASCDTGAGALSGGTACVNGTTCVVSADAGTDGGTRGVCTAPSASACH